MGISSVKDDESTDDKKVSPYAIKKHVAQLADALSSLPDNWIMCRDMRHAWRVMTDFHASGSAGSRSIEIRRDLICMRCETVRHEKYHNTIYGLDKVSQSYSYPDAYQIHGVPRGVKPQSIVQQEQYRRTMERLAQQARAQ